MANMDKIVSWVSTGTSATEGYWEGSSGEKVIPRIGMNLDPHLCDLHWGAALKILGLVAIQIPGDVLYHITNIKSQGIAPIHIKGM